MQMEGQQSCDKFHEVKYLGTPLFLTEDFPDCCALILLSWFDLRTRHPSSFLTSVQHDTPTIKGRPTRSNRGSQN